MAHALERHLRNQMLSARPARVVRRARCHQRRRSQKLRSRHHPRKLSWAPEYDSTQRLAPALRPARASHLPLRRRAPPAGQTPLPKKLSPKKCPPNRLPTVKYDLASTGAPRLVAPTHELSPPTSSRDRCGSQLHSGARIVGLAMAAWAVLALLLAAVPISAGAPAK
eukprot:COSAG02_NODE_11537_length_1703_cov_1.677681_3_plen_166_part_01